MGWMLIGPWPYSPRLCIEKLEYLAYLAETEETRGQEQSYPVHDRGDFRVSLSTEPVCKIQASALIPTYADAEGYDVRSPAIRISFFLRRMARRYILIERYLGATRHRVSQKFVQRYRTVSINVPLIHQASL